MKWTARGYSKSGYGGGVWAIGETREEVINLIVDKETELSGLELFKVPQKAEIRVYESGTIRFKDITEEEIEEIEVDKEELERINQRIE